MTENRLVEERKRKREALIERGINPYPYTFAKTHEAANIVQKHSALNKEQTTQDTVAIAGRIMTMRVMGKALFLHLQDSSGRMQVYATLDELKGQYDELKKLDLGDIIGVCGKVFATKTGEITIHAESYQLLTKTLQPLPEKFHGLVDKELRYRQRYLDLIMNPQVRKTFEQRALIIQTIRQILLDEGFLEVETPTLQPIYGGANARPFETHHNAQNMKLYLRISNELYLKRLLVGGYEKVFEFVKDFRNEGMDTTHNPEFTQVEWYESYDDYNRGMNLFEKCVSQAALRIHGTTTIDFQGTKIDLTPPWKRQTMAQAIREHAKIDVENMAAEDLLKYCETHQVDFTGSSWGLLVQSIFEQTCEKHLIEPIFIIDHPRETTPLAKPHRSGDKRFVERFEPYINTWEVGNGYSELNDPVLQRTLFEEQVERGRGGEEETQPMDEDFLTAIEVGMPPTSGVGMGVDRIVMLLTDNPSIRDVIFFPTMKPED